MGASRRRSSCPSALCVPCNGRDQAGPRGRTWRALHGAALRDLSGRRSVIPLGGRAEVAQLVVSFLHSPSHLGRRFPVCLPSRHRPRELGARAPRFPLVHGSRTRQHPGFRQRRPGKAVWGVPAHTGFQPAAGCPDGSSRRPISDPREHPPVPRAGLSSPSDSVGTLDAPDVRSRDTSQGLVLGGSRGNRPPNSAVNIVGLCSLATLVCHVEVYGDAERVPRCLLQQHPVLWSVPARS